MHLVFMRKVIIILFITISNSMFSQQFSNLDIQGRFDYIYDKLYKQPGPYGMRFEYNVFDPSDDLYLYSENSQTAEANLGAYIGGSLEALLVMYEATGDKVYLDDFVKQAYDILKARADYDRPGTPKVANSAFWFKDLVYLHGRILWPLAHFVYIVNSNNTLYATQIDSSVIDKERLTYGALSDRVNTNNREVMNYMLDNFWRTDGACMCKPSGYVDSGGDYIPAIFNSCKDSSSSWEIMEVNMQASFGCALIYMDLVNYNVNSDKDKTNNDNRGDNFYGGKAMEMARAYTEKVAPRKCGNSPGIFDYKGDGDYYVWKHHGWKAHMEYLEDIGHGSLDLEFPILFNKHIEHINRNNGTKYFEDDFMVKLRNTFTMKIYNFTGAEDISTTYDNKTTFACTVNGHCATLYWDPCGCNTECMQYRAKNWMGLHKFDSMDEAKGESVYDVIMGFYDNVEQYLDFDDPDKGEYNLVKNYTGHLLKGLADLVAAQKSKDFQKLDSNYREEAESLNIKIAHKDDYLNINILNETKDDIKVELYNLQGQLLMSETTKEHDVKFLTNHLSTGVYIAKVSFENFNFSHKVKVN